MPASRPRAVFEPIPPDLDLNQLVESTSNFRYVDRITVDQIDEQGIAVLEKLVLHHVIIGGKPLVIDGFEDRLDPWTFTPKWLRDNVGDKVEQSRNLTNKEILPLSIGHYLKNMGLLANQYFTNSQNFKDKSRQRIYLKDIDCPQVWHDKLRDHIPPFLYYLNESTGDVGGPGASVNPGSSVPGRRLGRGIAKAGDLMSCLPPDMRAENMMCYIGHEGTYTPSHREMCATMGHNIMVEASTDLSEDGKPERPGSSIWFMTESKDRHTVSEYWLSVLGHDIEVENHFAQISAWKKAPFTTYVVEQRPGDFILIPPLAPHQVWNRGTRTMKVAWNRTTMETLEMAMDEALPKARMICRDEQYKNKAIVYYALLKYADLLSSAKAQAAKLPPDAGHALLYKGKVRQLLKDFKRLFIVYKNILLSEMFSPEGPQEKCEYLPFDSNVTCAYCRGNVFNRFLSCPTCVDALGHEDNEPYDVCMDCYAMGRSCYCVSGLKWTEQFKWKELTQKYEAWRELIVGMERGSSAGTPLPLLEERKQRTNKTLAEVCKEQLKRRPFLDPKKAAEPEDESEEEIVVDDEGRVKRTVKKRSKAWKKNNHPCHICSHRHPNWKMAQCTNCSRWWCYGSLYRGHDDMPLTVMEDPNWWCAHCQGVCFAGACRKDPRQTPYVPKGTLLGHDTKKVADARSIEALVDFSVSNLNWIKDDGQATESAQMKRAREAAQLAKEVDPQVVDEDDDHHPVGDAALDQTQIEYEYDIDQSALDPALGGGAANEFLDPALRDDSSLVHSLSRATRALSPPEGTRFANGSHAVPDGYAPAKTSGFVAPAANMYPGPDDDQYQYPDPSDSLHVNQTEVDNIRNQPSNMKRVRRSEGDEQITMAPPKRRRVIEDATNLLSSRPKNDATRQYEKEKERKALDEAKRRGRYIAVQAALKGRKLVVKLPISGLRLGQILARQAAQMQVFDEADGEDGEPVETVLLRSDVSHAGAHAKAKARKPPQNPNKMKVRVEKDDDYGIRADRREAMSRNATQHFEEVNVASEDSDDSDADADFTGGARRTSDGKRKISAYLMARHEDDPDLPDELPENYKDRSGKQSRARARARKLDHEGADSRSGSIARTKKGTFTSAGKRPTMRPPQNDKSNPVQIGSDDDEDADAAGGASSDDDGPAQAAAKLAQSAIAEANRLAKLDALKAVDDDFSTSSESDVSSPELQDAGQDRMSKVANGSSSPPAVHRSIFDSKRVGKPIKIVSASAAGKKKAKK